MIEAAPEAAFFVSKSNQEKSMSKTHPVATLAADPELLRAIDRAAASEFLSRSAWLRRTVAKELAREGNLPDGIKMGRRAALTNNHVGA